MLKSALQNCFQKLSENKMMKQHLNGIASDPEGYGLRFLILANVAKDAINCGFYVNQSLNNKDIPDEKRKFVAALDMSNGVLMIATQLLLGFGFTSKKAQDWMTGKLFGGLQKKATDFTESRVLTHNFSQRVKYKLMKTVNNIPESCKKGFTAISTIVVTTIIAKRVIVPFIATPLAGWMKSKYLDNKQAKPDQNPVKNTINSTAKLPINQQNISTPYSKQFENFNNFAYKGVLFRS